MVSITPLYQSHSTILPYSAVHCSDKKQAVQIVSVSLRAIMSHFQSTLIVPKTQTA